MSDIRYETPKTAQAAAALLAAATGPVKVLAGGTDLIVQMRAGVQKPGLLVDVKHIAEMTTVSNENGAWRIGAAVACMKLTEDKSFSKAWPGVIDGVNLVGSVQVRGRASIGGNLCNASPAADSVPAMIAAGAVAQIVGPAGKREVPVEQIPAGPGKTKAVYTLDIGFSGLVPSKVVDQITKANLSGMMIGFQKLIDSSVSPH